MGVKIRTMWMTPFYLFSGVLFVYIFQNKIILRKLKYFFSIFLFLFLFSPSLYLYISISQKDKRTDYPGKEISQLVQNRWNKNFNNKISLIVGDEWYGGNLSYHLKSRPKWIPNCCDSKYLSKKYELIKNQKERLTPIEIPVPSYVIGDK